MNLENSETLWSYEESFNPNIDFCIWVLIKDGIHIPPFDKHPDGNRILRDAGLEPLGFRVWLEKVVATQHPYLLSPKTLEEYQAMVEQRLMSLISAASQSKLKFDEASERARLENQAHYCVQQYQLAAAKAKPFCRRCEPPIVWQGNSNVRQILWELWQTYQAIREEESFQKWQEFQQKSRYEKLWQDIIQAGRSWNNIFNGKFFAERKLYKELQKYSKVLPTLNIFSVKYPTEIEYTVPPVSIILSQKNGTPYSSSYRKSVLRASEVLFALRE